MAEPSAAADAYAESARILEDIVRSSNNPRWIASLSSVLSNLGNLSVSQNRPDSAFQYFDRGLSLLDDALSQDPADSTLRYNALNLHGSRANLLAALGRHAEAVADWDRVPSNDDPKNRDVAAKDADLAPLATSLSFASC